MEISKKIEAIRSGVLEKLKQRGANIKELAGKPQLKEESILEPERKRAPRTIQCPESDTVGAKKMEYLRKLLDKNGLVSNSCKTKPSIFLKNVICNINSMYACPHN